MSTDSPNYDYGYEVGRAAQRAEDIALLETMRDNLLPVAGYSNGRSELTRAIAALRAASARKEDQP